MVPRRLLFLTALSAVAAAFFALGMFHGRSIEALDRAMLDVRIDAVRAELRNEARKTGHAAAAPTGTSGQFTVSGGSESLRSRLVEDVKRELQSEMGLLSVQVVRERRASFVELYSEDNFGKSSYGTAGYLGQGYFVTVKHAVVALRGDDDRDRERRVTGINVIYRGAEIPATVIDTGNAAAEVHSGDWAIIRTRPLDLPALRPNTAFAFEFAEPIFRLGNDYSKGVIVSTGYIGQRMSNGLVTALTDGHPGVSGGGVLDRTGDLVGIPVGRMQGDYRFSFILPMRAEMLRKLPRSYAGSAAISVGAGADLTAP